jgi:integrase
VKYRLYIDEVGNSDLRASLNQNHRYLSLAGVIVSLDYVGTDLNPQIENLSGDQARWVYLPEWLIEAIEAICPLEDRTPERRVLPGDHRGSAYQAMSRACRNAKLSHYSPHSLRHRRITIWHQSGVPARELAERAGHARASMSLDVYSDVMPPDEVAADKLLLLLSRVQGRETKLDGYSSTPRSAKYASASARSSSLRSSNSPT